MFHVNLVATWGIVRNSQKSKVSMAYLYCIRLIECPTNGEYQSDTEVKEISPKKNKKMVWWSVGRGVGQRWWTGCRRVV